MPRITLRTVDSEKLTRLKEFLATLDDMSEKLESDLNDFYGDEFDIVREKITTVITDIVLDASVESNDP